MRLPSLAPPDTSAAKTKLVGIAQKCIAGRAILAASVKRTGHSRSRVVQGGEVVEIQRHGRTVAVIHPRVGASRSELLRLLRGRGFSTQDQRDLQLKREAGSATVWAVSSHLPSNLELET